MLFAYISYLVKAGDPSSISNILLVVLGLLKHISTYKEAYSDNLRMSPTNQLSKTTPLGARVKGSVPPFNIFPFYFS